MKEEVNFFPPFAIRSGSRDFEIGEGALCRPLWLADEENFSFKWFKKAKIMLETIGFDKIFLSVFSNFLHFYIQWKLADEILSIFQNCKRFDKEREKTLMKQSTRKEKLRKVGLRFITGCFIKSFIMTIDHFFVSQANSQPNFCFLISGWGKKYQKGKLGAANS